MYLKFLMGSVNIYKFFLFISAMYKSFPSEEMWLENLNFFSRKDIVFLLFYFIFVGLI